MSEKLIYKLAFWFFVVLLAILPFWSAIIAIVTVKSGLDYSQIFWLRVWYEPVLIILFLFTVFNPIWEKRSLKFKTLDYLAIGYLLWSILSIFVSGETISQGVQGLRYNGLFFGFYLLARFCIFTEARSQLLEKIAIYSGRIVALWAVLEVFIFQPKYWQNLGILPINSTYGYGIAHKVMNVSQAMATMEGPNQLGSFLLLPLFLSITRNEKKTTTDWLWAAVMILAIILSFSRSAILGLFIGLLVYLIYEKKISVKIKLSLVGLMIVLFAVSGWYFTRQGGLARDFFTHGASNQGHYSSMIDSFTANRSTKEWIFGHGIGTAGPASFNFLPTVQESWYLQVLTELGIVGLLLWMAIIGAIKIKNLKNNLGYSLSIIGISVAALFLHTWADNPVLAISFFILLGVKYSEKEEESLLRRKS